MADADIANEWPTELYKLLKAARVQHMAYVPDAGHSALIDLFLADANVVSNVLTTEEEGVAIAAGAWLGGQRSVLLMQSSGVGNCINMLSLPVNCRMPFFTLITTFVFAPYFATHVAADPAQGQSLWGFATAAAGLLLTAAPAFAQIGVEVGPGGVGVGIGRDRGYSRDRVYEERRVYRDGDRYEGRRYQTYGQGEGCRS